MSITLDFHTVFYLYTNTSLILHHFMNFSARKIPLWRTLEIRHRQPGTNSAPSGETSSPAMKNPIVTGTFFFGIHIEVFFFHVLPPKKYLKLNLLTSHMEIQFVNKAKLKLIMMGVFFFGIFHVGLIHFHKDIYIISRLQIE